MPKNPAAALSSLLRSASINDHDEILKAANAAIRANKTDFNSHQTRVVALLKLDRFDDALRAIDEGGIKLNALCALEKAYALYKTGKLDEATAVLQSAGHEKRSFSHVAAQVAYRAERFDEARNLYRRLLDTDAAGEENDLNINLGAACAQSEWQGFPSLDLHLLQDTDGFELCYNAACAHIARGSLEQAAELLQRALRLCDASDDLAQSDKEEEIRPILAQQAFVYAKMGKLKEALDLYRSISPACDEDPDLGAIVQTNLLALDDKPENPYVVLRNFQQSTSKGQNARLFFNHQSNILQRNGLVIDLRASKPKGVATRTGKLVNQVQHPTTAASVNIFSVLNAVASTQGATGKQLIRALVDLVGKRPHDVGLVLTIIQLQLRGEESGAALSTLQSFLQRLEKAEDWEARDVRFSPGLVALTVALMRGQGHFSSAKSELVKAVSHWKDRIANRATSLLQEAGIELSRSSNPEDLQLAADSFRKLLTEHQNTQIVNAGLVAALAPSEPASIQHYLADLPPVETLIDGVDVAALIKGGVAITTKSPLAGKRPAAAVSDEPARSSKRRRKPKLPKNYEEGKTPDPERWLPLRDRSSYRPKGKKGKKRVVESTQGGIVKEQETLELVGGGGVRVEKAPPSKKKKKGKK